MKKIFALTLILFSLSAKADYWTQKADFGGAARWGAVGFSIGTKGYIGTGTSLMSNFKDFWQYDPAGNTWTQKADFGGLERYSAIGFSIGSKGYIGTGFNSFNFFKDFWEYDPLANSWTQKTDFGGPERASAIGFSIGNKGYIGTGYGFINFNYLKDFWEYDPLTNAWTQKMDFGGLEKGLAAGFTDGTKGYLGTGTDSATWPNGKIDFWEWDAAANIWTQKADFAGIARNEGCAFWLCPFGYIGSGTTYIGYSTASDFWKYNISSNTWIQIASFGAGLREMAVGFSIGTKGYVGTGWINDSITTLKKDFWEYTPDTVCATGTEEFLASGFNFQISPNPAKEFIVISSVPIAIGIGVNKKIEITITDIHGKKVYETKLLRKESYGQASYLRLPTSNFQKGIYFVEASDGKQKAVKKFVKE